MKACRLVGPSVSPAKIRASKNVMGKDRYERGSKKQPKVTISVLDLF